MHVYIDDDETTIEGTVSELRNLSEYIKRARIGSVKSYELSSLATAEPYTALLDNFILDCNGSKIKGSIDDNSLKIEFSEEMGEIMASYFEFDEDFVAGHHTHFDQYGNEDYFEDSCIDMIVQVSYKNT